MHRDCLGLLKKAAEESQQLNAEIAKERLETSQSMQQQCVR